jgi:hypothetical protein
MCKDSQYNQTIIAAVFVLFCALSLQDTAWANWQGHAKPLHEMVVSLAIKIVNVALIFAPVVGAFIIYGGIKTWMDGNSGPSQGKGAFTKMIVGAMFLNARGVIGMFLTTLEGAGFDVRNARHIFGL